MLSLTLLNVMKRPNLHLEILTMTLLHAHQILRDSLRRRHCFLYFIEIVRNIARSVNVVCCEVTKMFA